VTLGEECYFSIQPRFKVQETSILITGRYTRRLVPVQEVLAMRLVVKYSEVLGWNSHDYLITPKEHGTEFFDG